MAARIVENLNFLEMWWSFSLSLIFRHPVAHYRAGLFTVSLVSKRMEMRIVLALYVYPNFYISDRNLTEIITEI